MPKTTAPRGAKLKGKAMEIRTNNTPRATIYGSELTPHERTEFDYVEDLESHTFFRYRGSVYDPGDFTTTSKGPWNLGLPEGFDAWDGYAADSMFSGVLIRFPDNDEETIIVGSFYS
tara:strand:+ start:3094 stop:3444 length:351 start_codon:yes stop_codon:yes gene_type:complete